MTHPCLLLPDARFSGITAVSSEYLRSHGIRALVLDIDNTLALHDDPVLPPDIAAWLEARRAEGILLAVSSNNEEERVAPFARRIGVQWVSKAHKPAPEGCRRAQALFGVPKQQMALIGDQLFTDVLGARLFGIQALLVRPLASDHIWYIRLKRALEKPLLWYYEKKGGPFYE